MINNACDKGSVWHYVTVNELTVRYTYGCTVSGFGLAVRGWAGKQKDYGSACFSSLFSSSIVVHGHCLTTLPTQLMKHSNGSHSCPTYCRVILVVSV